VGPRRQRPQQGKRPFSFSLSSLGEEARLEARFTLRPSALLTKAGEGEVHKVKYQI